MNQNGGIHKGGFAVLCHRNGGSESPGILISALVLTEKHLDDSRVRCLYAEYSDIHRMSRFLLFLLYLSV